MKWKYFWKYSFPFSKGDILHNLYIVNFLWIVSSTSQSLLFVPFDAGFCTSVFLSFLFWRTYCHIFGTNVPHTWIS